MASRALHFALMLLQLCWKPKESMYTFVLVDFLTKLVDNKAKLHRAVTSAMKQVDSLKLPFACGLA